MTVDPVVYFFAFGLLAGLLRADLRLPGPIYDALSFLLLLSIGLKGGVELARHGSVDLLLQSASVIAMGIALPLLAFPLLRLGRLRRADAASIAAHYGSVSVGTFAVAISWLASRDIPHEPYLALFVVLLEVPAIVVGILLARSNRAGLDWRELGRELFLGRSVLLLAGGLVIGAAAGAEALTPLEPVFVDAFKGVLALFLLEMGLIAAARLGPLREHGLFLVAFAVLWPLFAGSIGTVLGLALGLSPGGAAILAVLAASASYIAAPAAMRIAVPEANPSLSLAAALGLTFPFNMLFGIPIFVALAQFLGGASP
ncbi:MAG: sodium-dependent bicarbonate transport family permease [Gammaproteobacteria bacterium]|nr:MAG: sodium-dependent bicarbonate transport family permease [Gammaproteobacteria bacterium]